MIATATPESWLNACERTFQRRPLKTRDRNVGAAATIRWLLPRDRLLRGASWSLWGGATCRRRGWRPRWRCGVTKPPAGGARLRRAAAADGGPDRPDRDPGHARAWQQPSNPPWWRAARPRLRRARVSPRSRRQPARLRGRPRAGACRGGAARPRSPGMSAMRARIEAEQRVRPVRRSSRAARCCRGA